MMTQSECQLIINAGKVKPFPKVMTKYAKPKPLTNGRMTYIVFNKKTGLIKIGRSTNHKARIQALNNKHSTNLQLLTVFNIDCEATLHKRYKDYHVGNEWFNIPIQLLLDSVFNDEINV